MRKCVISFALWLLMALSLSAQSLTSLSGTVSDPSGAVVPAATVVLVNVDTQAKREAVSDLAGRYGFPQILPGNYRITVKAQGFSDMTQFGLRYEF